MGRTSEDPGATAVPAVWAARARPIAAARALTPTQAAPRIVAALTVVALALRLACVRQSLFGDELFLYAIVHDRTLGHLFSVVHDTEKTPPLYFVLGWIFARGPEAEVLVRLPSLIAGVATVPLVWALGARTVGRGAALLAAAWFALSPFEVFYATEGRGYALVAALVVASTLCLLRALDGGGRRWWAGYVVAAVCALYTHYIAVLVLAPQVVWALWTHRRGLREQLVAHGLVALAFAPWLPSFVTQARHSESEAKIISTVAPVTPSHVSEIAAKALFGHPFVDLGDLPGPFALALLAGVGLMTVAALVGRAATATAQGLPRPSLAAPGILIVLLTAAPLAGLVLYSSQPDTSFLLPRNLSVGVPYALLLLGWAVASVRPRRLAAALGGLALVAVAIGTVKALDPDVQRPDGRANARWLDANVPPGAPIVDAQPWESSPPGKGTRTYLTGEHRLYGLRELPAARAEALRTGRPLFISTYRPDHLQDIVRPVVLPRDFGAAFRLVRKHTSRGLLPIVVREYVPR
jgi:mannosyltransferase